MPRIVLEISYDGAAYAGWQIQENAVTVQGKLEQALSVLLQTDISVVGAGRTDTGVHAKQLFVHFDTDKVVSAEMIYHLNGILPHDIAVNMLGRAVNDGFHVRFDAINRAYEYHIVQRKTPYLHEHSLWVRQTLNWDKMNEAAQALLSYKDFASFCKAHGNNRTTFCDIFESRWEIQADRRIFHITANRFLRGMVRAIVGTLLEVGAEKMTLSSFHDMIQRKDRSLAGPNVAAKGLFLTSVTYPPHSWEEWIHL